MHEWMYSRKINQTHTYESIQQHMKYFSYNLLGVGVAADEREAVSWYRKAAELGQADAQYNLGSCYDAGVGVETDKAEAKSWYQKAANQGHKGALVSLRC